MLQKITVRPLGGGWSVQCLGVEGPMVFRSGAAAERAARDLAIRLSDAGAPSELTVELRDGSIAGRFVVTPGA